MLARLFLLLEQIIIRQQCVDIADTHNRAEMLVMCFAAMVGDDPVGDLFEALFVLEKLLCVNPCNLFIDQRAVAALQLPPILNAKAQHVLICDCIGDDIIMQAFCEEVSGGAFAVLVRHGIIFKYRRAGKAEHLRAFEEVGDRLMRLTELRAVAFVEDKHDPLAAQAFKPVCIVIAGYRRV